MSAPIDERRITRHKIPVKPDSHSYQQYDVADDEGLLHASLSRGRNLAGGILVTSEGTGNSIAGFRITDLPNGVVRP
jgi:hypothetical protein